MIFRPLRGEARWTAISEPLDSPSTHIGDLGFESVATQSESAVGGPADFAYVGRVQVKLKGPSVSESTLFRCFAESDVSLVRHDHRRLFKTGIDPMARPRVVTRVQNHTGTHRIELDIALAFELIPIVLIIESDGADRGRDPRRHKNRGCDCCHAG